MKQIKITQSAEAAQLLQVHMSTLDHEELWAIFLNRCNGLIASEMLTKGTLDYTPIDSRLILRHALLNNASGVILMHNHPSGDPTPSKSDIHETEKVHDACKILDILLVDHIVIANESFYSFAEEKTFSVNKSE